MSSFWGCQAWGKPTWLQGLAVEALKNGYTAYFLSAHELVAMIRENLFTQGRYTAKLRLSKPGLLIIDEVEYASTDDDIPHVFFQIISNRYEKGWVFRDKLTHLSGVTIPQFRS